MTNTLLLLPLPGAVAGHGVQDAGLAAGAVAVIHTSVCGTQRFWSQPWQSPYQGRPGTQVQSRQEQPSQRARLATYEIFMLYILQIGMRQQEGARYQLEMQMARGPSGNVLAPLTTGMYSNIVISKALYKYRHPSRMCLGVNSSECL